MPALPPVRCRLPYRKERYEMTGVVQNTEEEASLEYRDGKEIP